MDPSASTTIDQLSLDRLSEKDKTELRQFISNEQQRTRVQTQTHALTEMCWKKCLATQPVKANTLDSSEEACLSNCVDRFIDLTLLTSKHLSSLRR